MTGTSTTEIDPKDSLSYGLSLGYFVTPQVQLEFVWSRQATQLEVSGTNTVEIGDVNLDNYHGGLSYHFGESDAERPSVPLAGPRRHGDGRPRLHRPHRRGA